MVEKNALSRAMCKIWNSYNFIFLGKCRSSDKENRHFPNNGSPWGSSLSNDSNCECKCQNSGFNWSDLLAVYNRDERAIIKVSRKQDLEENGSLCYLRMGYRICQCLLYFCSNSVRYHIIAVCEDGPNVIPKKIMAKSASCTVWSSL